MYGEPSIEAQSAWCGLWAAAGVIAGGVAAAVFVAPTVPAVACFALIGGWAGYFHGAMTVYSETAERVGIYLANRWVPQRDRILTAVLKDRPAPGRQAYHAAEPSNSAKHSDVKGLKDVFNGAEDQKEAGPDSRYRTERNQKRHFTI